MAPCKFYREFPVKIDEIGGGSLTSFIHRQSTCLLQILVALNEWENCITTPSEGPCWDMADQFETISEWENWTQNRLQSLA